MILNVTIGLGILAFLFIYMAYHTGEKHPVIQILALAFSVLMMLALAGHINTSQDYCDFVKVNETISDGGNFTAYEYDHICVSNPKDSPGLTAWKLMNWFIRLIGAYVLVMIIYWLFLINGVDLLEKAQNIFRK